MYWSLNQSQAKSDCLLNDDSWIRAARISNAVGRGYSEYQGQHPGLA